MPAALAGRLLTLALVLGVLGDLLWFQIGEGLGFALWVLASLAILGLLLHQRGASDDGAPWTRDRVFVLATTAGSAFALLWRDADWLLALNIIVCLGGALLLVWMGTGRRLRDFQALDGIAAGLTTVTGALVGTPTVVRALGDGGSGRGSLASRVIVIGGGLALAFPPLLIATALLGAADPVFKESAKRVVDFVSTDFIGHFIFATVLSWVCVGWLHRASGLNGSGVVRVPGPTLRLPFGALAATLYGLTALLTAFVGLQARVLFGGAEYVMRTAGLTVAEYARSGFFELVALSVFVLVLLFVADRALAEDQPADRKRFRAAGGMLLLLTAVVMISALVRLRLYIGAFGLSEDRLMAFFILVGVAVSLGWFARTVLLGDRLRFVPGLLVVASVWVHTQNLANPDAIIARNQLGRARAGATFDAAHLATLSADAVPALVRHAPGLPAATCAALAAAVEAHWKAPRRRGDDWRASNVALWRARAHELSTDGLAVRWGCTTTR